MFLMDWIKMWKNLMYVDMFLHLSSFFNLSVSQTLEMGKIVHTCCGRASIPNLEELLKNHNTACKDQFKYIKLHLKTMSKMRTPKPQLLWKTDISLFVMTSMNWKNRLEQNMELMRVQS